MKGVNILNEHSREREREQKLKIGRATKEAFTQHWVLPITAIKTGSSMIINNGIDYIQDFHIIVHPKCVNFITEISNYTWDVDSMKTLKNGGKAALNHGISWLYPYYTKDGQFSFRLFPGYEILPIWQDSEHTILEGAIRLYLVAGYDGIKPTIIEKVEVFDTALLRTDYTA